MSAPSGYVAIVGNDGFEVWLYVVYAERLRRTVGSVIARRSRWDHPEYLARMIFSALTSERFHDDELGFGISNEPQDLDAMLREILVVDTTKQRISVGHLVSSEDVWRNPSGAIASWQELFQVEYETTFETFAVGFLDHERLAQRRRDARSKAVHSKRAERIHDVRRILDRAEQEKKLSGDDLSKARKLLDLTKRGIVAELGTDRPLPIARWESGLESIPPWARWALVGLFTCKLHEEWRLACEAGGVEEVPF